MESLALNVIGRKGVPFPGGLGDLARVDLDLGHVALDMLCQEVHEAW